MFANCYFWGGSPHKPSYFLLANKTNLPFESREKCAVANCLKFSMFLDFNRAARLSDFQLFSRASLKNQVASIIASAHRHSKYMSNRLRLSRNFELAPPLFKRFHDHYCRVPSCQPSHHSVNNHIMSKLAALAAT